MSEKQHSPLPWEIRDDSRWNGNVYCANTYRVAQVDNWSAEEKLANAEFIVTACNFHERLVNALKGFAEPLCSCVSNSDPDWHSPRCKVAEARALLSEIEKG